MKRKILYSIVLLCTYLAAQAHGDTTPDSPVHITKDLQLQYKNYPNGDRVPDFSFCGYRASDVEIPHVAVKVRVSYAEGDATERIQRAIDYVSSLPVGEDGFRGAVLLEPGKFTVNGSLVIKTSGVVLRGSGAESTTLVAAGTDRATLIRIAGVDNIKILYTEGVTKQYIPLGAVTLPMYGTDGIAPGDQVLITYKTNNAWLEKLGTDRIGRQVDYTLTQWAEGDFDIKWYRTVTAVTSGTITVDVPLTNSLDPQYGKTEVQVYRWTGRINNVGVENLTCTSSWDGKNKKDENHRWMAITVDNAEDGWVRRVTARNFVSSAVAVWESARRFTVEDCKSLDPIGEIGGYRRYAFQTLGQQVLFQRCYAENAYHGFSVGFTTAGPNAFVQCYDYMPHSFSGAVGGWSNGTLFDRFTVDGGNLSVAYRDVDGQGGGWSGANSLFWNCRAAQLHMPAPPTAYNWAYGSWAQGYGDGHHEIPHSFLKPESFYYAQLSARQGRKSAEEDKILVYVSNETTAPAAEYAAAMSRRSLTPDITMDMWIDTIASRYPIEVSVAGVASVDEVKIPAAKLTKAFKPDFLNIKNGVVMLGDRAAVGRINRTSMWRGSTRPSDLSRPTANLVRFVPGRVGRGLTDDLDTLVADLKSRDGLGIQNFPALWYERRRDDHARTRRADADVWAPFYEQPFSRSGEGEAFDRLSRYDLTKYNTWYWLRLKQYADLADLNSLLFVQEHYLQHNIIEEGAHWADYPWRSANNVNDLGFAENPPYAGDKRIYMAEEFYDVSNAVRARFHRDYIRKSLEEFRDNRNVIHHLGVEYTGPLHFVKFWLYVIGEWESETGVDAKVFLTATKDVQDAILADEHYRGLIDIIDIRQWHYRADGSLYAPLGGQSLAPRQHARLVEPGAADAASVYRAVSEYRTAYPEKAVVYSGMASPWAVLVGGGSMTALPAEVTYGVERMKPIVEQSTDGQLVLGAKGVGYVVYSDSGVVKLDLSGDATNYQGQWVDAESRKSVGDKFKIKGGGKIELNNKAKVLIITNK